MVRDFPDCGWLRFEADPDILTWAEAAHEAALLAAADPEQQRDWLQCEGTWFVGVDALRNDESGAVAGVPLRGAAITALGDMGLPTDQMHKAQVSVVYPGYPKARKGESDAAFSYRVNRDAAHVDGLLADGPDKRRYLREPHAYVLGVSLTRASPDASPLVIWEGSQNIMGAAFREAFAGCREDEIPQVDITEIYKAARRQVFAECTRIEVPALYGQATLIHRHVLHGVAPWAEAATAAPEGRMIAYFRPYFQGGVLDWISQP